MKKQSYKYILILIILTATTLTAAQVYFTFQNYQVNKLRFIDDIRQSLNTSIENYFAKRAKNGLFVFSSFESDTLINGRKTQGIVKRLKSADSITRITVENTIHSNSWTTNSKAHTLIYDSLETELKRGKEIILNLDSSRAEELQSLTQKVMISISEDLLNLGELYDLLNNELEDRNLSVDFALNQENQGRSTSMGDLDMENTLSVKASSAYLGRQNSLSIDFENATLIILQRGIVDLILSISLVGLVIGTMIHLYKIIDAQKQLALIKDDLISNITHEFKTPIATIFSALEGVTNFNETNDQEKTRRYLALSNDQLNKLNGMVEKMLETATIDQGKLNLNEEQTEAVSWTKTIVDRFALVEVDKHITFTSNMKEVYGTFDRFHSENALSNLIDNAIKYGGDEVRISIATDGENVLWQVEDNGGNIPKPQREKVFDKLYRVPTGNQHDVKGFGIGLYYARKIAELHGGQLTLNASDQRTVFTMSL